MSVMSFEEQFSFSGRAFLGYLTELKHLVGEQTVKMILRKAGWLDAVRSVVSTQHTKITPYQALIDINREIEDVFGENAQKTVVFASAKKSFVYSFSEFEVVRQTKEWVKSNSDNPLRLRKAVEAIIYALEETTEQKIKIQESSSHYHLTFNHSMVCSKDHSEQRPHCFYVVGMIRGGLHYIFDEDLYPVQELCCVSANDPNCEFIVRKFPFSDYEKGSGKTGFLTLPAHMR